MGWIKFKGNSFFFLRRDVRTVAENVATFCKTTTKQGQIGGFPTGHTIPPCLSFGAYLTHLNNLFNNTIIISYNKKRVGMCRTQNRPGRTWPHLVARQVSFIVVLVSQRCDLLGEGGCEKKKKNKHGILCTV